MPSDSSSRSNLLGSQSSGLAAAILSAAAELSTSDQAKRKAFLKEKWTQGGRPFVSRVKRYGKTEEGDPLIWSPWFEEFLEAIGDARLSDVSVQACSQLGKAQPLHSKILTPSGWSTMGEIQVGDYVIAGDGSPTRVTGVYPQGLKDVWEVVFDDGAKTQCCDEHLWLTQTPNERRSKDPYRRLGRVRQLSEIRETLRRTKKDGTIMRSVKGSPDSFHSIQYVGPVQTEPSRHLPLDPYLIGALLGDGSFSIEGQVTITCAEQGLLDLIWEVLPSDMHLGNTSDPIVYRCSAEQKGAHTHNRVLQFARDYGLEGCKAIEKHIPDFLTTVSVADRLFLLQGLMDTDGYLVFGKDRSKGGSAGYGSSSKRLAEGVRNLVLSLGGNPKTLKVCHPKYVHKGEKRQGADHYKFVFSLPEGMNPFRLERKAELYTSKTGQGAWKRFIREVNPVGETQCQCISVEHPSRLYVTDDYIVTHNTLAAILLACDVQTTGRMVFGMVYDKKEARTKFAATQFRPIMDHWLEAMKAVDQIEFDRSKDTVNASRKMLEGVNSVFSFASTADASLREGKSAVSSELAGWSGDWLFEEERSQWPLGAVDVAYRRLDNSAIATKPVRSWGTPGAGLGVEKEIQAAEYHFYPHGVCEECGETFAVDAFGSLLKPFERTDAYGQTTMAHVSESHRPVEWFHHDPENPVGSAYFACPHCEAELTERSRTQARFKCLNTGIWLRDFLDQLPKDIPNKRYRVGIHYGPLLRASKINLAADLIRNGLEMADARDWVQQGLGHSTSPGVSALTMPILERAIAAPSAPRLPEVRLAGIDQGRSGYHTLIKDVSLPLGWQSMPVAQVMEKAVRTVLFSGEVSKHHLAGKLREYQVQYGGIDNEPDRTFAGEIQRTTTLAMMDQRAGLGDAYKKSFVEDSGKIPCILIRNEKFLRQVMMNFFLVAEDNQPLTRLPDDWTRWIENGTERSPLRHYMGVKCDPESGKWEKADANANGLYYADMFSEAALYVWLSQGGEGGSESGSQGYVPGGLASVMRVGGGPAGLEGYQPRGGVVGGRPSRRRRFGRRG